MVQAITVTDYGVIPNSPSDQVTDITTAAAAAFAAWSPLYFPPGTYIANGFQNPGVELTGPGYVMDGDRLLNARQMGRVSADGLEYMAFVQTKVLAGNPINISLFGDSTVLGAALGADSPYFLPQNILGRLLYQAGIANATITNSAVGGTGFSSLDTSFAATGSGVDAAFIKYIVNDASSVPASFDLSALYTTIRTKFEEIRDPVTGRPVDSLSVCVFSGTTANAYATRRDARCYDRILPMLRELCREFKFTFIDTFTPYRDADSAQLWMDSPVSLPPGTHLHPLGVMNCWVWGDAFNAAFPMGILSAIKGRVIPLTTANSWVNYGPGSTDIGVQIIGGVRYLRGRIKNGTMTAGTTVATLPVGYRPDTVRIFSACHSGGYAGINVTAAGNIVLGSNLASNLWLSLDGINY